jgi:hypothetical protein
MLYWLGVYVLVVIGVAIPFLLLYIVGSLLWLTITAIRSMMRSLQHALAARPDFSRTHWSHPSVDPGAPMDGAKRKRGSALPQELSARHGWPTGFKVPSPWNAIRRKAA